MSFIIDTCAEASQKKGIKIKESWQKKLHQRRYKSETDHQILQRISKVFLMA